MKILEGYTEFKLENWSGIQDLDWSALGWSAFGCEARPTIRYELKIWSGIQDLNL